MTVRIHVINGPNLNLLGEREPSIYGSETLRSIEDRLYNAGKLHEAEVSFFQSNHEGALIDEVQKARKMEVDFLILNPASLTHTSIALRDAVLAADLPFIEVHITNPHAREPFRNQSFFSDIANGVICGLGTQGYDIALSYAIGFIGNSSRRFDN